MKQVWFVTGSSRGFGRALVRAALEAGDLVAATARRPEQLAGLGAEYGDSIHPIALDVTDPSAAVAAIPALREQGGGLIMQFSSVGGRVGGSPGIASYQAAKFAIDGFSRVLQAETAPFGVKVIVVEPSGFKTDWAGSSMIIRDILEAYAETVGAVNTRLRQNPDGPAGDPVRAAEI